MVFAHDTEVALAAAAALVNVDLPGPEELDAFVAEHRWTGSRTRDAAELDAVRALQPRLRRWWELELDPLVDDVNALLHEAGALPQLVAHDDWPYHLHATAPDAPLADRIAVEAAMAFVDVVRQGELDRLQVCDAPECGDAYVDLSKNRSRRYCSTACSNRVNVKAFRARRRA